MKSIVLTIAIFIANQFFAQVPGAIEIVKNGIESSVKSDATMVNYYFDLDQDTIWFNQSSEVVQCNYMISIEKSHNHCSFYTFGEPMNGFYTIKTHQDQMISEFKGTLKNGLYLDGNFTRSFNNGAIQLTGQYANNCKIGYWSTYDSSGTLLYFFKFIPESDNPVVEVVYDENGEIIETTDEEEETIKRLRKGQ